MQHPIKAYLWAQASRWLGRVGFSVMSTDRSRALPESACAHKPDGCRLWEKLPIRPRPWCLLCRCAAQVPRLLLLRHSSCAVVPFDPPCTPAIVMRLGVFRAGPPDLENTPAFSK